MKTIKTIVSDLNLDFSEKFIWNSVWRLTYRSVGSYALLLDMWDSTRNPVGIPINAAFAAIKQKSEELVNENN